MASSTAKAWLASVRIFEAGADLVANGQQPAHILPHRPADLELGAAEARFPGPDRILDE